jgi:hypothetical protein
MAQDTSDSTPTRTPVWTNSAASATDLTTKRTTCDDQKAQPSSPHASAKRMSAPISTMPTTHEAARTSVFAQLDGQHHSPRAYQSIERRRLSVSNARLGQYPLARGPSQTPVHTNRFTQRRSNPALLFLHTKVHEFSAGDPTPWHNTIWTTTTPSFSTHKSPRI